MWIAARLRTSSPHGLIFTLQQAFISATSGQIDEAAEVLASFEPRLASEYYRSMADAAAAVIAAHRQDEETAKRKLTIDLHYLRQYNDAGSTKIGDQATWHVANALPWCKGRARKLQRRWSLPTRKTPNHEESKVGGVSIWLIVVAIFAVLRACSLLVGE